METIERIPTRGDTVTLQTMERRFSESGQELHPLVYEVNVLVTHSYSNISVIMGREMSRFCYVAGSRGKGRNLPPVNPYGEPGRNGYRMGVWNCIQKN